MNTIPFYQALGNLFYAVASTDGKIVLSEKKGINDAILHDWNTKLGNIDSKEIIYQTLRELIAADLESNLAFENFKTYFQTNSAAFSEATKQTIMQNAEAIASVYAQRNKSELILLTHLNRLFWN